MPAYITEEEIFTASVKLIEDGEPVDGGADGPVNIQAKQLADRTLYLKRRLDALNTTVSDLVNDVDDISDTVVNLPEPEVGDSAAKKFFFAQI